jgi:hypothetical protein
LALCQLESVKKHPRAAPKAVVPIYPPLDFTIPPIAKKDSRPYKVGQGLTGIRGEEKDYLLGMGDMFDWAYIPYGTDMRDPEICPVFSKRADLPANVFVIAAELDILAFEALRLACNLAGRAVPGTMQGRKEKGRPDELELNDERFHWESKETGVKWLLVPDVIHAFDFHGLSKMVCDKEATRDGEAKALKYMKIVGEWWLAT